MIGKIDGGRRDADAALGDVGIRTDPFAGGDCVVEESAEDLDAAAVLLDGVVRSSV